MVSLTGTQTTAYGDYQSRGQSTQRVLELLQPVIEIWTSTPLQSTTNLLPLQIEINWDPPAQTDSEAFQWSIGRIWLIHPTQLEAQVGIYSLNSKQQTKLAKLELWNAKRGQTERAIRWMALTYLSCQSGARDRIFCLVGTDTMCSP